MLAKNWVNNVATEQNLSKTGGATFVNNDTKTPTCRVATLGLDQRMRNALELFLKSKLDGRFALVEADAADLFIIDLDSYGGHDLWSKQSEANPDQPVILLSVKDTETNDRTYFVRKPMRPQELIAALTDATSKVKGVPTEPESPAEAPATGARQPSIDTFDIEEEPAPITRPVAVYTSPKLQQQEDGGASSMSVGNAGLKLSERDPKTFIGSAPDIDPDDPRQVAKAQFDPDVYLIGKLAYAVKLPNRAGRAVRLELDHGAITLIPETGKALVDIQHTQLRTLAVVPMPEENTKFRFVDGVSLSDVSPHRIWQIDALLWTSALLASRGRVPAGTDITAKLTLKRWPNLTRLAVFPNAVRITSFLSREPVSLVDTARALKIPQRFVFAFHAAADALDLIERSNGTEKKPQRAENAAQARMDSKESANRGLFRRILSHLRK